MFLLSWILPAPTQQINYTLCLAHLKEVIGEV